jgi:hypothetical protein
MKFTTKIMAYAAILLLALLVFQPATAHAYVGPTAGLSLFSAAVGLLVAIFSALAIILLWPIRMLLKWIKGNKAKTVEASEPSGAAVS